MINQFIEVMEIVNNNKLVYGGESVVILRRILSDAYVSRRLTVEELVVLMTKASVYQKKKSKRTNI